MKKLLGILALAAMTTSLFAQGTVSFGNQTGLVKQWTSKDNNTIITMPKSGGYVQLIAAPQGSLLPKDLFTPSATSTPSGKQFANYTTLASFLEAQPVGWVQAVNTAGAKPAYVSTGNGIFNGGTFTVTGIAPGGPVSYFALGWTGAWASFDAAMADALLPGSSTMVGISGIFTSTSGNPLTTPAGTAVFLRTSFAGITVAPVFIPEPGTFALAGLGLASLLIFRRRK